METSQLEFDQAYRASQPPEIRALMDLEDGDDIQNQAKIARAVQLAQKGFPVDVPIMVWSWDPYLCMLYRQQYGFTWVPSALQPPVNVAPGIGPLGNLPAYDPDHPPAGSIRVSTNLADYPPFDPPVAPPSTVPITDPVGLQSVGNLYLSVAGETYQDGARFTNVRGTFLKHVVLTPFGRTNYWEKVA
jgi:hypothetical protein